MELAHLESVLLDLFITDEAQNIFMNFLKIMAS